MDRDNTQLNDLKRAYVRVCSDIRRHIDDTDLAEIERLEREALEAAIREGNLTLTNRLPRAGARR